MLATAFAFVLYAIGAYFAIVAAMMVCVLLFTGLAFGIVIWSDARVSSNKRRK